MAVDPVGTAVDPGSGSDVLYGGSGIDSPCVAGTSDGGGGGMSNVVEVVTASWVPLPPSLHPPNIVRSGTAGK
ncbi:hypothetical protein N8E89_01460 [Phyllobacterium sp. A18/5-2]|uniref:hypothetical protein n=1 Tax=Phyllobacterium sp. A18/5-2 TaxID=2978392 RepID=UPI0021CA2184|nr:hypothetical protein [Phyllobacterium sp. A18/5-2]UXN64560.1 hypothetical protein N8E89_01460 [Phyllobacterium sp. A18/5-2]